MATTEKAPLKTIPTSPGHGCACTVSGKRTPRPLNQSIRKLHCATLASAALLAAGVSHAGVDISRAKALLSQNACLGCHSVTSRLVGPSYKEVAAKYQGGDPAVLGARIKSGGSGKWGQLEMPAQANLSDADTRLLAEWILIGSPN